MAAKRVTLGLAVALVMAVALPSLKGQTYYVASVSGRVEVFGDRWDGSVPLRLGMKLLPTDSIRTGANAYVLLLTADGVPETVCANCKGAVKDCVVGEKRKSRKWGLWPGIVNALRRLVASSSSTVELVSASVRGRAGEEGPKLVLLQPRNSAVEGPPVRLKWEASPDPESLFTVSVFEGTRKIWVTETDSTECVLPQDLLKPGAVYFWMVRAGFEDTILEKSASFRVLPEDSLRLLQDALASVLSDSLGAGADPYVKALLLAAFGLYNDAFATVEPLYVSGDSLARGASRDLVLGLLGKMGVAPDEIAAFGIAR